MHKVVLWALAVTVPVHGPGRVFLYRRSGALFPGLNIQKCPLYVPLLRDKVF